MSLSPPSPPPKELLLTAEPLEAWRAWTIHKCENYIVTPAWTELARRQEARVEEQKLPEPKRRKYGTAGSVAQTFLALLVTRAALGSWYAHPPNAIADFALAALSFISITALWFFTVMRWTIKV